MTTVAQSPYRVLDSIIDAAVGFVAHLRRKRPAGADLSALSAQEISAIARDLAVSENELRQFARQSPEPPKRLQRMLAALQIAPDALLTADSFLTRNMPSVCAGCGAKARCTSDLNAGLAAQRFQSYCPNAPVLEALRARA